MCSSECDRVSTFPMDLEERASRNSSGADEPLSSSNSRYPSYSRPRSSRPMFSLYVSLICLLVFLSLAVDSATLVKRRAASMEDTDKEKEPKECYNTTPCGWAVYIPSSRRMDYYIRNVCRCPAEKDCLKSEDDLSVNAYVYRCKVRETPPINKDND